ncbi:39S ribosomal protein L35, mitochondrial [Eufriesea mexicana]|uniref:Large ribosomal subunit protein bL35m n=1 Tax=Eufriesea mexicana TaxID=516756 RepID=A0A310SHF9_9HYME|nr:PREDICTED: 39S ribosomal protein L35, mitochondrial [Eufriesea mexicana]OAD62030.1 39S ribosomal protein L35, mitochondrial [Eufriesea mexicana]
MLRIVSNVIRGITSHANVVNATRSLIPKQFPITQCIQQKFFGVFSPTINSFNSVVNMKQKPIFGQSRINSVTPTILVPTITPVRTVIKYSLRKGKRKTVKAVFNRFYRLNWGIWIRTRAGRHSMLWKKSLKKRRELRQHVFCNASQSTLLDKMVTMYWKRPHYYVDDPYNPYHTREEFSITRRKPKEY